MIARPDREIDHLRTNPAQYAPYPGSAFVINSRKHLETKEKYGAPDRIRTCDLWFRRPIINTLVPVLLFGYSKMIRIAYLSFG